MPVPPYLDILDSEIDPESPITTSLMTRLRDNLLSVIGGGVGAPRLQTGILAIGGSIYDGVLSNAFAHSGRGYYDFEGGSRSSALTLPALSVVRSRGDLVISSTITVDSASEATQDGIQAYFGASRSDNGNDATANSPNFRGSGGGGSVGDGGDAFFPSTVNGGTGLGSTTGLRHPWVGFAQHPLLGGRGGKGSGTRAEGGGALILLVEGDLDMTGGVINADGQAGTNSDFDAGGGGGAGSILVVCTGTLTNGTFRARGGAGGTGASSSSGGGGGGNVCLVASAYAGTQTMTVTGGGHTDSGTETSSSGASGSSQALTLTEAMINGLYWR